MFVPVGVIIAVLVFLIVVWCGFFIGIPKQLRNIAEELRRIRYSIDHVVENDDNEEFY